MSKDLYVKNIAHDLREDELRQLFTLCGKVTYIHMVKDPKTGTFLGCAYVKMSSEAEAKDALVTLDGTRLNNREIVVEVALPQRTGRNAKPGTPAKSAPGRADATPKGKAPVKRSESAFPPPKGKKGSGPGGKKGR